MNSRRLLVWSGVSLGLSFLPCGVRAQQADQVAEDPSPKEIVKSFCANMQSLNDFTVEVEVLQDEVQADGAKILIAETHTLSVHRPDRLRAESVSPFSNKTLWKNKDSVTILGKDANLYAQAAFSGTNDELCNKLVDEYDLTLPLADLVMSQPCDGLASQSPVGTYVGLCEVNDRMCHQLLFRGLDVDWQMWIEDGDKPWLRKLVINYKYEESHPQFTAIFGDVETTVQPDKYFEPELPEGARRIEFKSVPVPAADPEVGQDEVVEEEQKEGDVP